MSPTAIFLCKKGENMLNTNRFIINIQFDSATGARLDALVVFYEDTHSSLLRKLVESQFLYILDSDTCFDLLESEKIADSQITPRFPVRMDEYTLALLDELVEESGLSRSEILRGMVINNCKLLLTNIEQQLQ